MSRFLVVRRILLPQMWIRQSLASQYLARAAQIDLADVGSSGSTS